MALALGHTGGEEGVGGCARSRPRVFVSKQHYFTVEITRNQPPLSGQMGGKHMHLRHCSAANAETMWLW